MGTAASRDRLAAARSPGVLGTIGLLGVTAAWGSTFFLIKDVVARIPAPDFLAVRFLLAAAVLGVVRPGSVAALSPALRRGAARLALVYGVAQILQTVGLQHTSASVSGFVTGMYVVFTPLLAALLLRQRVPPAVWGAVGLATVGLAVLSLRGLAVGYGEALTLASAAFYAVHILGTGAVMTSAAPREAYGVAVVQMAVISATCALGALPGGHRPAGARGGLAGRGVHGRRGRGTRPARPDLGAGPHPADAYSDRHDRTPGHRAASGAEVHSV